MRNVNKTIISASDAVSQNSISIDTNQIVSISFHAYFSDTDAGGSVKVQVSNDLSLVGYQQTIPTNWVDLPTVTAAVTSGSAVILTVPNACYQHMRVVYTQTTPGTGTITVNMNGLSI